MEDAYVLTDELCDLTDKSQIPSALQSYYRRRIMRSAVVQGLSRFSSDIIINAFSTPFDPQEFVKEGLGYKHLSYPSILTWNLKSFLPLIFYAQFSYLYSFAPSNFEKGTIEKLVKESLQRNTDEANKIYQRLTQGCTTFFTAKTMSFMQYDRSSKQMLKLGDAKEFRADSDPKYKV